MERQRKRGPGKKIEDFRLEKGLTQAELAETCGFSVSLLSAIENGHHTPSHRRIIKSIWRVVGVRPTEWFSAEMSAD